LAVPPELESGVLSVRRHLVPVLLACAILSAVAACSSTDNASTTPPTTPPGAGADSKSGAATLSAAKCRALHAFQQVTIVANKPDSQQAANQDKVTKALTSTSEAVKKAFPAKTGTDPQIRNQVDKQVTYLKKLVAAQNPTSTEKDDSTKARDLMQHTVKTSCAATPAGAKAPGTTVPGAKPAPTTTAAPKK
jgi:hypothetical protein